jgi:hypothetical protein
MEVTMAVLAEASNTTGDGRLNMLGVFDVIHARSMPYRHPKMNVVLRIKAEIGEKGESHTLDLRLLDPDGKVQDQPPTMPLVFPAEMPLATPEQTIVIEMLNLSFQQAGAYEFEVLIDGNRRRTIDLYLHVPPEPHPPD